MSENKGETIKARQDHLIAEFNQLQNWEERYRLIIDYGKSAQKLSDALKTSEALVKGCQSQVWFHAKLSNGKIELLGDSDALLVKGLVAILIQVFSDATPDEILKADFEFLRKMGFESHLSPSRANGLQAMIKQIRNFAIVYSFSKA